MQRMDAERFLIEPPFKLVINSQQLLTLRQDGIGRIKLHSEGLTLDGDAYVMRDLHATAVKSRQVTKRLLALTLTNYTPRTNQ